MVRQQAAGRGFQEVCVEVKAPVTENAPQAACLGYCLHVEACGDHTFGHPVGFSQFGAGVVGYE